MRRGILIISLGLMFCIVGLGVPPVYAVLFGFSNITNNDPTNAAIGEAQLSVDVTYDNIEKLLFNFVNSGPVNCSITHIYFDGFLGIYLEYILGWDWVNSDDVNFSYGATPANLPGWNTVNFAAEFGIGADEPVAPNGVGPSESLEISVWPVVETFLFADLIDSLETGETRIGIHVQGFNPDGSESFVTSAPVPEPATMLLMGCGLLGLGVVGRKKLRKRA